MDAQGDPREIRGVLDAFFETGTEGVLWSLHDPGLPGYDALNVLEDGDALRVLDSGGGTLWEGTVDLDRESCQPPGSRGGQAVLGLWVHGVQRDMDPEAWARMFLDGRRAVLRPGKASARRAVPHPFRGPPGGLPARLAALPEDEARKLFGDAVYPWLVFYSDGQWTGLAREWGLDGLRWTLALLGNPTEEQLKAWASYPKGACDRLMPYTPEGLLRLGYLFALHATLLWSHPDRDSRRAWLERAHPALGGEMPLAVLRHGTVEAVRRVAEAASGS